LLATLSAEGLVDEYMLDVYPIALGNGVHLVRDIPEPITLSRVSSRQFPHGVNVRGVLLTTDGSRGDATKDCEGSGQ